MKTSELINVALTYAVVVAMANLVLNLLHYGKPDIALIVGAVVATEVAAWSYQKRVSRMATSSVKLVVGALVAVVCVIQSLAFQYLWHWMSSLAVHLAVGTIASFLVPIVFFDRLQERIAKTRNDR